MEYVVVDNFENKDRSFDKKKDAEEYKNSRKAVFHQRYCVDKYTPSACDCLVSMGMKECSAHKYARKVKPHTPEECTHSKGWLHIKEKGSN